MTEMTADKTDIHTRVVGAISFMETALPPSSGAPISGRTEIETNITTINNNFGNNY